MSKYNSLWEYLSKSGSPSLQLTFDQIASITNVPIDHSFLQYKKELLHYGYEVKKISMKEQTITFTKLEE